MKRIILISCIIGQSLSFVGTGGFHVSPVLFWIMYLNLFHTRKRTLYSLLPLIGYTLLVSLTQFSNTDYFEFLKSLIYFISFFLVFFNSQINNPTLGYNHLRSVIAISVLLIFGFEIIQVFEHVVLKSNSTLFLLSDFSISTAQNAGRFEAVNLLGYIRPLSFFHEPSYLGSTLLVLLLCLDNLEVPKSGKLIKVLCILGILFSISITNYIGLLIYFLWIKRKDRFSIILKYFLISFGLVSSSVLVSFLRLDEILLRGSSAWARIILPIEAIEYEIFSNYALFGRSLGNTSIIFDNSFFLIICYFGFLTPIFYYYVYKQSLPEIVADKSILLGLMVLFFLNGAIFTPESSFLLSLIIMTIKLKSQKNLKIRIKKTEQPI